jgi:hypothetical protein
MMAYKPPKVVSRHASNLGPSQPLRIANEKAGNADSSRTRAVGIHDDEASFRCNEGCLVGTGFVSQARRWSSLAPLDASCLLSWMP